MPPAMYRIAARSLLRQSLPAIRSPTRQRFLSTAPPEQKSRSWKNTAARWGLAAGGVYYYNTSNVFAEEPAYSIAQPPVPEDPPLQTLDSFSSTRRPNSTLPPSTSSLPPPPPPPTSTPLDASPTSTPSDPPRTPEEYEEEAGQQGAFNEETGEINWDCPCLGGMAHGPCGEEFRAAFSCFVYSKEEPKGMDCIERFKGMQDCFRQHPDVYGAELEDDDNSSDEDLDQSQTETPETTQASPTPSQPNSVSNPAPTDDPAAQTARANAAAEQVARDHGAQSESDELVPKAALDAGPSRGEK